MFLVYMNLPASQCPAGVQIFPEKVWLDSGGGLSGVKSGVWGKKFANIARLPVKLGELPTPGNTPGSSAGINTSGSFTWSSLTRYQPFSV